jgi:N-acetylmuramate 1-kinase
MSRYASLALLRSAVGLQLLESSAEPRSFRDFGLRAANGPLTAPRLPKGGGSLPLAETSATAVRRVEERIPRIEELVKRRFGNDAAVTRLLALPGDASTRGYARAWLRGSGTPPSLVVMILTDRGVSMSSDELAVFAAPPAELPYVNVHRFLASLGVAIPELYVDAAPEGLLLLEDIGDTPLWEAVQGCPEEQVQRLFEQAIDQLLLLQLEGTERRDEACIAFGQAFDERLFAWEFDHFIEHGLVERIGHPLPEPERAALQASFTEIARYLDRQPRVLNHRDFHAWNLFVCEGRIRVIDFQDALLAPAPYDLATLLGDRDTPAVVHPRLEQRLLSYYAEAWAARGGTAWEPVELWDVYAACALQKAFKVVGRFHYLDRVKGKPGYLRYIPPTLRQIRRLLDRRPDLREVRAILGRYFPELKP